MVVLISSFVIGFLLFARKNEWITVKEQNLGGAAEFAATTLTLVLVSIHVMYLIWWLVVFIPEEVFACAVGFGCLASVGLPAKTCQPKAPGLRNTDLVVVLTDFGHENYIIPVRVHMYKF